MMTLSAITDKIIKDIQHMLSPNYNPLIYIGKTNNLSRRTKEHSSEDFAYTLPIVKATPNLISILEENLISKLSKNPDILIANKESNSEGNAKATILYICIKDFHPNDIMHEYDEMTLLGNDYPLTID